LLLVLTVTVVFSQTVSNQTDANGKKQGPWEEKTQMGTSKGNYVDSQKNGCWTTYSPEGKLMRIENFSQGKRNGISIEIDPRAGYLTSEMYYVNDLPEGTAKKYFYGTNPASFIDYSHGKINGKKKIYYENSGGKIQEESEYKDDVKDGFSNYYNMNGDLIVEYHYVNNRLEGVQKTYYAGKKLMSEQVFADNMENGLSKEFYENGQLKTEGFYTKGVQTGTWKEYSEDGKLKNQGNYLNGEKDGKWLEFDASGKVVKTSIYSKGKLK
jgi:antitoxin component YwqK of YwqJK toxin-antitoxin module